MNYFAEMTEFDLLVFAICVGSLWLLKKPFMSGSYAKHTERKKRNEHKVHEDFERRATPQITCVIGL